MIFTIGRIVLGVAVCCFGFETVGYGRFVPGFFLPQEWTPSAPPLAYLFGGALLIEGVGLIVPRFARIAALALAATLAIALILVNAGHIVEIIFAGTMRTRFLEPLAVAAAALVVAAECGASPKLGGLGRNVFAFALCVFGLQHFLYASFLTGLVPAWLPMHLAFVYATGAALVAGGLAIASGLLARVAAQTLALMFVLWVVMLHVPRAIVAPGPMNGLEWASAFVALAMAGASLIIASATRETI